MTERFRCRPWLSCGAKPVGTGILSAVAAGMMQNWLDLLPRQTSTRLLNRSVWSLEFDFNGLIFLLLGLQLPDIIKAVVSHGTSLWLTLFYRRLDLVAFFSVLFVNLLS